MEEEEDILAQLAALSAPGSALSGEAQPFGTLYEFDQLNPSEQNQLFNALGLRDMEKQNVFKKESLVPQNDIEVMSQLTAPAQPGSNIPTLGGSAPSTNPLQNVIDAITDTPVVETLTDAAKAAGTEVGKVIDKIFQSIGLRPPTKIIGNPQPGATVVWGQTGGSPVVYTGTTPAGTQTGVTTGLPWLDAVVNQVIQVGTGQQDIPSLGDITGAVIDGAINTVLPGVDVKEVADAANKVLDAAVNPNLAATEDTEGLFGVDIFNPKPKVDPKDAVDAVTSDGAASVVGSTDPLVNGLTTEQAEAIGAAEVEDTTKTTTTTKFDDAGTKTTKILDGLKTPEPKLSFTPTIQTETVESSTSPKLGFTPGEQSKVVSSSLPGSFEGSLGSLRGKSSVTPAELNAILASERTSTVKSETSPELKTTLGGGGGGGGGGFSLPVSLRGVREEPGDVVDIDYLYDFAKGLDQPFITTTEDEEMKNLYTYQEGGGVDTEDAIDLVTRRPGEYGRTYFNYATPSGFTPTGRALGGGALNPNAIQIPEYNYTRTLKPEFGGPVDGATYTPPTIDTPPAETTAPEDASGTAELIDFLGSLQNIFGGGGGSTGSTFTPGASDTTTTITNTPAESTFNLGDPITTETLDVASDPVSQYLQSLGYGLTPKSVTAGDIQSAVGEGFSLADIAGAFGTTEDIINQVLNPGVNTTASTTGTAGSSTFTAGGTDTTTVPIENAVSDYLVDNRGFTIGAEKTVTQEDLKALRDQGGFTVDQIAAGLNTSTDNINALLNYEFAVGGRVPDAVELAMGGMAMGGPNYLAGATDGMADLVPATIGGTQPAALSDGEFVIPADVVSHLGNGNSDAGAKQLYAMMDRVRDERTGTTKQGPEIDPTKMMPA